MGLDPNAMYTRETANQRLLRGRVFRASRPHSGILAARTPRIALVGAVRPRKAGIARCVTFVVAPGCQPRCARDRKLGATEGRTNMNGESETHSRTAPLQWIRRWGQPTTNYEPEEEPAGLRRARLAREPVREGLKGWRRPVGLAGIGIFGGGTLGVPAQTGLSL